MKKGIILQPRDLDILLSVYEYTVTSFRHLKRKHFAHTNLQTASNRLNRLVKSGYLKSYRVGLVIYQGKERQVNKIFTITPKSISILSIKNQEAVYRTDPVLPQFNSLVHDLLLNEVSDHLKKEHLGRNVVNAKLLKFTPSRTEQIPDLVMEGEYREFDQSIELELTSKSEKRYREIITNYRLSSRFKKVLFIVSDGALHQKLWQIVTGVRANSHELKSQSGKFYFRSLESCLPIDAIKNEQLINEERTVA